MNDTSFCTEALKSHGYFILHSVSLFGLSPLKYLVATVGQHHSRPKELIRLQIENWELVGL